MEGILENHEIVQAPAAITHWDNDPLGSLLVQKKKLKESELNSILSHSKNRDGSLAFTLIRFGLVSEQDIATTLSEITGLSPLNPQDYPEVHFLQASISTRFLKSVRAVPIAESTDTLVVAMVDPRDAESIQALAVVSGKEVSAELGLASHIEEATQRYFDDEDSSPENSSEDVFSASGSAEIKDEDIAHLRDLASEAPIVRIVNILLQGAVESAASDIHLEQFEDGIQVRYRIDGILKRIDSPPANMAAAIISRIKIMAKLDIAERRLPQDGRIQIKLLGKHIDMRIATAPSLHGEGVVIRLLDNSNVEFDFHNLGFDKAILDKFLRVLSLPHGIVLVTGPTGSGKTTTLYAALNHLNTEDRKIITVEDPVEYQVKGINQIPVKPQIGLTFSTALRSIVRQDPDVIMIGEMRDVETARIAVQSALTGHLVFSTLHTNDAASGVTRLLDMGIEEYLLTSTVNAILAQRLVRVLCPKCREPYTTTFNSDVLQQLRTNEAQGSVTLYRAKGCSHCNGMGYRGRMTVLELLVLTDPIRKLVLNHADGKTIQREAVSKGMRTMFAHGVELALAGKTTMAEVHRVSQEGN